MSQESKERGDNRTPPDTLRQPKGSTYSSWNKSLEAQLKYCKEIMEEAGKRADNSSYVPKLKISKRFSKFFDSEVIEARQRSKRKKKRKQKNV